MSDLVLVGATALVVGAIAAIALRLRERKHRALREESLATRARLHSSLATGGVSVLAVGRDGVVRWFEGGSIPGTDAGRSALLGRSAWEALHASPQIVAALRAALTGGRGVERATVGTMALDVSYAPRFDDAGMVSEAVAVIRDVTVEHHEAERAARLAEVRSRILAVMSYRLRGQLSGITAATELAASDGAPARWLGAIDSASSRTLAYVEHLVDFLELDAGQVRAGQQPFSLREVVETVAARHREQATADGSVFVVRYPRTLPEEFEGDGERLRQALDLLVTVALGTNPGGQVLLNVDVVSPQAGDASVVLSVEDDGRGLSPEARARVFDAFDSASAMWATRSGSSGLELPLAQRLATMLGGTLDIESAPGVGTTLRLCVRLRRAWGRLRALPQLDDAGATTSGVLLLVDDDSSQRAATAALATALGWTVLEAGHGGHALRLLEERADIDGVLTELHMPVCDGLALLAAVRDRGGPAARLPFGVATADARPASREVALRAGADAFVLKPLRRDVLASALGALSRAASLPSVDSRAVGDRSPLDGVALARLRALDAVEGASVARELAAAVAEALPIEMIQLADAIRASDESTVASVAASMQVSARLVGAPPLAAALRDLQGVPLGDERARLEAYARLADEAQALRSALVASDASFERPAMAVAA